MRDRIEIGSTPCDEECEQLGPNYDPAKAQRECRRFLDLIRRTLGPEPPGALLKVVSNSHDFGVYYEVACYFDPDDEEATAYAFKCESDAPATWGPEPDFSFARQAFLNGTYYPGMTVGDMLADKRRRTV